MAVIDGFKTGRFRTRTSWPSSWLPSVRTKSNHPTYKSTPKSNRRPSESPPKQGILCYRSTSKSKKRSTIPLKSNPLPSPPPDCPLYPPLFSRGRV
eukprot:3033597-Rhodomonas_salina.1